MKAAVMAVAALLLIIAIPGFSAAEDGEAEEPSILLDTGDGWDAWYDIVPGSTLLETVVASLEKSGHTVETSGDTVVSIDGLSGTAFGTSQSAWYAYGWSGDSWDAGRTDMSERYTGGSIAVMLTASGTIKPSATPLYPDTWTSYRGSQTSPGISSSHGPGEAALPVEWYATYTTGNVDSSLLYSDGFVYHTTTGNTSSYGNDSFPHVYCISSENGSIVWSQRLDSDPEAVTLASPVIMGDWLIIGSCTGHVYLFDRFSGDVLRELVPDGDEPFLADISLTDTYELDGLEGMGGQVVRGGITNIAVYSGALFFGTDDGTLRCYTVDPYAGFDEVWRFCPEEKGTMYFHPPAVTKVGDRTVVLMGSYAGMLHCVDAVDGFLIWSVPAIDLTPEGSRYPGSVSSVVPVGNETALVTCKDGEMSPFTGTLSLIDLKDGSRIWSIDAISTAPTCIEGIVYVYLSPSSAGSGKITAEDGSEMELDYGYYALWADSGEVIWYHASSATVSGSAGITFADGRLYSTDYSSGMQWPYGGGVTCLDADTGNQVWRVQLEPYSRSSYSMVSPTVVDGMVLVANDYGAVYCISDTPGVIREVTGDIRYEITGIFDWSWIMLMAATACVILMAARFYRGV